MNIGIDPHASNETDQISSDHNTKNFTRWGLVHNQITEKQLNSLRLPRG